MTYLVPWASEPPDFGRVELSDAPLTILVAWPFGDGYLQTTLRELLIEYVEDYRGSDKLVAGDDAEKVAGWILALHQLAEDMEKLAGLDNRGASS